MGKLNVIVWKEVLDLVRDPKFIAGLFIPLIVFLAMGSMFSSTAASVPQKPCIALVDEDSSQASRLFAEALARYAELSCEKPNAKVVLEKGFGAKVREGVFDAKVYYIFSSTSISESEVASKVDDAVKAAARDLFLKITGLKQRLELKKYTVYKGRVLGIPPEAFYGIVFGFSNTLIWAVFIVAVMVFQLVAISIASEKEYKTLEILLTQPIKNTTVLLGKLVASILVAFLEGLVMAVGMFFYFQGIASMSSPTATTTPFNATGDILRQLQEAGLTPTPTALAMYLGLVFASLIFMLSIGVVVGAVSNDTKSAGSLSGILVPVLIVPAFFTMFIDIDTLPLVQRAAALLFPFTPMFVAGKYLVTNNVPMLLYGLVYTLVWGIGLMALAAKIYTSESLLTFSAKTLLKRFRRSRLTH